MRFLLVIAVLAVTSGAAAQPREGAFDDLIDFVLRPTEDAVEETDEDDIWNWDTEPEPSLLESEVGPPLLGPTGEEVIGPPLAGPEEVREELEDLALAQPDDDPFAAPGINLGPFVIRPSLETGVTATDNVAGTQDKNGAVGLVVAPEVIIRAEDDRYAFEADLYGEWIFYNESEFDDRVLDARVTGRYDLTDQTSLNAEAGYSRYLESFTDDDTPTGAAERPAVDAYDAMLGVEQRFGRFSTELSGFADRSLYHDVPLVGGGTASRRGEDNVRYGGRLRTGYRLGAGTTPFVEVAGGRRDYDQTLDDSGFRRSGPWAEFSGGLIIDRGEKLSGEVSVGFRHEELEDAALPDIDALLLNAAILWSPRRLTEVRVDLYTDTSTTSVPFESGSVLYSGLITLERRVTPRVTLAGGEGVDYEYSVGDDWTDVTFIGFAEASYAFNRFASIRARYEYERLESTDPGTDYDAHTVGVRVRVQR